MTLASNGKGIYKAKREEPVAKDVYGAIGEKSFTQLWRDLCKEGWKARKPTGIAKGHRYVKPGIKGRLDESRRGLDFFEGEKDLMAFARLSGLLDHQPSRASVGSVVRRPIGKQLAYAVIGVDPPCVPSPTTNQASVAPATTATPDDTHIVQDDTEFHPKENATDEEEGKTESDDRNETENFVDLDMFDSDNFMEGLRKEPLFGPTADNDVNFVDSADFFGSDSDADDDGVLEDNEVTTSSLEGANDVEDVPMTEDVSEAELLGFTEDGLREIAGNEWVTYDEDHSAPIRDGLAKHLSTDEDGAVPRGTFSRFMNRYRFVAILKFLHFNNNEQGGVLVDTAWEVRPLLVEIYCGADESKQKKRKAPTDTLGLGPKTAVRNISKVLMDQPKKRLIVTDSLLLDRIAQSEAAGHELVPRRDYTDRQFTPRKRKDHSACHAEPTVLPKRETTPISSH
ncbi:hypothetical protein PInf_024633 [Phytophthora infestans]|nr:hypothetical protein PInf_024633 [Phytophthora infestans]